MKLRFSGPWAFILTIWAAVIFGVIGWVLNIIGLWIAVQSRDIDAMIVLQAIGVFFAPLGAVLGWLV